MFIDLVSTKGEKFRVHQDELLESVGVDEFRLLGLPLPAVIAMRRELVKAGFDLNTLDGEGIGRMFKVLFNPDGNCFCGASEAEQDGGFLVCTACDRRRVDISKKAPPSWVDAHEFVRAENHLAKLQTELRHYQAKRVEIGNDIEKAKTRLNLLEDRIEAKENELEDLSKEDVELAEKILDKEWEVKDAQVDLLSMVKKEGENEE